MKKIIYYILLILIPVITFNSCVDEVKSVLDTTGDVDIHSFTINGVEGTINADNSTISVILPAGSALTGLSPVVGLADGAEVTPNNGEAVDFADNNGNLLTVTYTVTNKDLYQKYTVSVDVARAKITISHIISSITVIVSCLFFIILNCSYPNTRMFKRAHCFIHCRCYCFSFNSSYTYRT